MRKSHEADPQFEAKKPLLGAAERHGRALVAPPARLQPRLVSGRALCQLRRRRTKAVCSRSHHLNSVEAPSRCGWICARLLLDITNPSRFQCAVDQRCRRRLLALSRTAQKAQSIRASPVASSRAVSTEAFVDCDELVVCRYMCLLTLCAAICACKHWSFLLHV